MASPGYPLCFDLWTFAEGHSLPHFKRMAVEALCVALAAIDIAYLELHPETPSLYEADVVYKKEKPGIEKQWWDIPKMLSLGYGDCKGLAAWRAAELILAGEVAEPYVTEGKTANGGTLYHVRVAVYGPDGNVQRLEDPSRDLGMT